jgi:hypothetical protein
MAGRKPKNTELPIDPDGILDEFSDEQSPTIGLRVPDAHDRLTEAIEKQCLTASEQPTACGQPTPLMELISALIKTCQDIPDYFKREGKMKQGGELKYMFLGEEQIISEVRQHLLNNGLCFVPAYEEIVVQERYANKSGTIQNRVLIKSVFNLLHVSGAFITIPAHGEGIDSGDKSVPKAKTGAFKYALRQTLLIASGDDPDKVRPENEGNVGNGNTGGNPYPVSATTYSPTASVAKTPPPIVKPAEPIVQPLADVESYRKLYALVLKFGNLVDSRIAKSIIVTMGVKGATDPYILELLKDEALLQTMVTKLLKQASGESPKGGN